MNNTPHNKWHILAEHRTGEITIGPEEYDRFHDLLSEMKPLCGEVPEDLLDDYIDLDKEQCKTIEKNLDKYADDSIKEEMSIKQMFDNDIENLSYEDILKTYYSEEQLLQFGDDVA